MAHIQRNNSQSTNSTEGNTAQSTNYSTEGNTAQSTNSKEGNTIQSTNSSEDLAQYGPLLSQAVKKDDWNEVKEIIRRNSYAITAEIDGFGFTILHYIVVHKDESTIHLNEILTLIPARSTLLEKADHFGKTALSHAAILGKKIAASSLVEMNDGLLVLEDKDDCTPLHLAAEVGRKEMFDFLMSKTNDYHRATLFRDKSGASLLHLLVSSKLYGTALDILKKHDGLLGNNFLLKRYVLRSFAQRSQEFASGNHNLNCLQRKIYKWIPITNHNFTHHSNPTGGRDVENAVENSTNCLANLTYSGFLQRVSNGYGKVVHPFWNTMKRVSWINHIHDKKLRDEQAVELVKFISEGMIAFTSEEVELTLKEPLLIATRLGIVEFVKEITKVFPHSVSFINKAGNNLFHIAVLSRQEHVFKIINKTNHPSISKYLMAMYADKKGNNILHLAAKLQPSSRISGAALQMQRELQWFKAIKNIASQFNPNLLENRNKVLKTPREVFTEEHKKLVEEGREWMKNAAQSYTVVGAFIITMTFATAFQVPGGTEQKEPNYLHDPIFITFVISDVIALCCSCFSVLMCLGILTSRYSEEDFLKSLPTKLIIGLLTLCMSIGSMTVAFAAAIQIALNETKWQVYIAISTSIFSIIVFAILQFPLLRQICNSTYGSSFL